MRLSVSLRNALYQLAALQSVHDGGGGSLAHVGVIGQLAHGDLAQFIDPFEQQELWRGETRLLDQALGVHVDGTNDLAQCDQHFIMFFHGFGVGSRVERGKILLLADKKVNIVITQMVYVQINFVLG